MVHFPSNEPSSRSQIISHFLPHEHVGDASEDEDVPDPSEGWYSCFNGEEDRLLFALGVGDSKDGTFFKALATGIL